MKFVKYGDDLRVQMVLDGTLNRKHMDKYLSKLTPAEQEMYRGHEDKITVEHVYWDDEEQEVVVLAVDYFGELLYAKFPTWAAYYEAMLNHLLGPIE